MKNEVSELGWKLIAGAINADDVLAIKNLVQRDCGQQNPSFHQLKFKNHKEQVISKISDILFHEIENDSQYEKLKLEKVWYVHSQFKKTNAGTLPYIPHFDKRRYLKIMIYLEDVGLKDGAYTTASVNTQLNEEKRKKINKDDENRFANLIDEPLKFERITASAGDAIIFDTNCPHFATPVEKGGDRKVLRLDFCDPDWNKHLDSKKRRLFNFLFR